MWRPMKIFQCTCLGILVYIYGIYAFSTFPPATFKGDWFSMSSVDSERSFIKKEHGLGSVPILMKVLVKPTGGNNADFVFEAFGSPQTEDDTGTSRGGITYIYSDSQVILWSCTQANGDTDGHSLIVGGYWGAGEFAQSENDVTVQIQAWSRDDFYDPDFVGGSYTMTSGNYKEILHDLGQIPELVRVVGSFTFEGTVYYFHGTGSQENNFKDFFENNFGGILFAYNERYVRLWICDELEIFTNNDGWGHMRMDMAITEVKVKVYIWLTLGGLKPHFDSGWLEADQSKTTFFQLQYPESNSDRFVDVQLLAIDGENEGFIFPGTGMAQTEGLSLSTYVAGGVLFAYSQDAVRLWVMDDISSNVGIVTVKGWGGQNKQQLSSVGKIRVRVWCGEILFTPFAQVRNNCVWMNAADQESSVRTGEVDTMITDTFPQCAIECFDDDGCIGLSHNDRECKLYANVRFGSADAVSGAKMEYQTNSKECDECQ